MRFSGLSFLALVPGALGLVPLLYTDAPNAIPNEYIIVYKKGASLDLLTAVDNLIKNGLGSTLGHVYAIASSFNGRSATLPPLILDALRLKEDTVRLRRLFACCQGIGR
jgi:hypothetical protein